MNFLNPFDDLHSENQSKKNKEQFVSRKQALKQMSSYTKKFALAALPLGVISSISKAKPGSTGDIIDVLNFALTLELLEAEFYNKGFSSGIIPVEDQPIFSQIRKHENAHVQFLKRVIRSLGGNPVQKPNFDFTSGGRFKPFSQYYQFLKLSQAFEDTGVRAYKGQAGNLQKNDEVLTAALRIHSVEARHAAEVRRLRTKRGFDNIKAWITNDSRGSLPEVFQAVYEGEANTTHAGLDVTEVSEIPTDAITEAWDEPLTREEVLTIAGLFISG